MSNWELTQTDYYGDATSPQESKKEVTETEDEAPAVDNSVEESQQSVVSAVNSETAASRAFEDFKYVNYFQEQLNSELPPDIDFTETERLIQAHLQGELITIPSNSSINSSHDSSMLSQLPLGDRSHCRSVSNLPATNAAVDLRSSHFTSSNGNQAVSMQYLEVPSSVNLDITSEPENGQPTLRRRSISQPNLSTLSTPPIRCSTRKSPLIREV